MIARQGAAWQRAVAEARTLKELRIPEISGEEVLGRDGWRLEVHGAVYADGFGVAWIDIRNGRYRLPKEMHEWAAGLDELLCEKWPAAQFPFVMRVGRLPGGEVLADMFPPSS